MSHPASPWFHQALARCGLAWLVRATIQRSRATILIYHDPDPDVLSSQLDILGDRYTFVSLRDVVDWVVGRRDSLPPRSMAITLDDGWAGNIGLEPVFRRHGLVPTIFVCTQVAGTHRRFWWEGLSRKDEIEDLKRLPDSLRLERLASRGFHELAESDGDPACLTWDQIRKMQSWADIQPHTRLHPILPRCDDARAWREIAGSLDELRGVVDAPPYALAYPNGDCSGRERQMAVRAGYQCGLTIEAGFVARGDDPYALRRITIPDTAGKHELLVKASGIHHAMRRLLRSARVLPDWT